MELNRWLSIWNFAHIFNEIMVLADKSIMNDKSDNKDAKDELVQKGIKAQDRAFTGPYGLQIGVTDYCNYSCVFCATFSYRKGDAQGEEKKFLKLDYSKFRELVMDAAQMKVNQMSIVGVGEPFLHPDIMGFIELVKENGIRCMVTTNGAALTRRKVDQLIDNRLDIINISLNAATPETYAIVHGEKLGGRFNPILETVAYITERKKALRVDKPHLALRFVITRLNRGELEDFVDKAIELGANELFFQNYLPPPFAEDIALDREEKKKLADILNRLKEKTARHGIKTNLEFIAAKYADSELSTLDLSSADDLSIDDFHNRHSCYVGWTYVMILAGGEVMPCCYCSSPLGNINESSFKEIWFGDTYNTFRQNAIDLPKLKKTIISCRCFDSCGSIPENLTVIRRFGLT